LIRNLFTIEECVWLCRNSRAPRLRSMSEFAESEIVLPNGPRKGMKFSPNTQPWVKLYLAEVDSGRWNDILMTGGRQGGKTLIGSQTPVPYHLFEVGESVIYALPDLDLAAYKWNNDLLPVIQKTKYAGLLPTRGAGSRGGQFSEIEFRNGAHLYFMTGGGGDAGRQGRTSRVVVITEADKMDGAGGTSEETDKIQQIIHCTDAFGSGRVIYSECTLTTKEGYTWRKYEEGTASRIALHCPICGAYVTPERDHLTGWEGIDNELDVREAARYHCPACADPWTEEQRYRANLEAVLVHRGQTVTSDGTVEGPLPRTRTLGFRWSAVNNMFLSAGDVAVEMWRHDIEQDEGEKDLKEREICQYLWAVPYEPPKHVDQGESLTYQGLMNRQISLRRGQAPASMPFVTVGCDVGKFLGHWAAVAWDQEARGHILDYGVVEFQTDLLGIEKAIPAGLKDWRENVIEKGWDGHQADKILIDSRFRPDEVRGFCLASGSKYLASAGYGTGQRSPYHHPKSVTGFVSALGDNYHIVRDHQFRVVNINSDFWKTFIQTRLMMPIGQGAFMTLFQCAAKGEHNSFVKHCLGERQTTKFLPSRGKVTVWELIREHAPNHWFDSLSLAAVAGHMVGVRVVGSEKKKTSSGWAALFK